MTSGFLKVNVIALGIEQAVANLAQLPKKVAFKHLRKALSAAGGTIKKAAAANVPVETGLLKKSLIVKTKIPDASWDIRHHGRPAYTIIGPRRRFFYTNARKQKFAFNLAKKSHELARQQGYRFTTIGGASRYAHVVEKRKPWLAPAQVSAGAAAAERAAQKLAQAFEIEAAALPKTISTGGLTLAG